ncbi:MAG TPA: hypothetical protein VFA62_02860 [Acidimicrobiia bacterium]|nr:hypothetical protein [Acidimicrobiia bacterium]
MAWVLSVVVVGLLLGAAPAFARGPGAPGRDGGTAHGRRDPIEEPERANGGEQQPERDETATPAATASARVGAPTEPAALTATATVSTPSLPSLVPEASAAATVAIPGSAVPAFDVPAAPSPSPLAFPDAVLPAAPPLAPPGAGFAAVPAPAPALSAPPPAAATAGDPTALPDAAPAPPPAPVAADRAARQRAAPAVPVSGRSFTALLVLLGAVLAFLVVHGRFDRRDPRRADTRGEFRRFR